MPENAGSPASRCVTPMVKGLIVPAANPHPTANTLMPTPTKRSHPSDQASAIDIGTSVTVSSNKPMVDPMSIETRLASARSRYRRRENRRITPFMTARNTPLCSRT